MSDVEVPAPQQEPSDEAAPRPARRLPLTNTQVILIALIVVGGRLVVDFSQRIIEGQEKLAEQRNLEAQIQVLLDEKRELEAGKTYYNSPAYIEAWAHSEGKMVRQGEVLVVPIYDSPSPDQSTPGAALPASPDNLPPWKVWWTLFFDSEPGMPSIP